MLAGVAGEERGVEQELAQVDEDEEGNGYEQNVGDDGQLGQLFLHYYGEEEGGDDADPEPLLAYDNLIIVEKY